MVLKVPDKSKINWSGGKVVPLCGVPRDTEGSHGIFECGQVVGIAIREGTVIKNRRRNGKTDGEEVIGPLRNGTNFNRSEYVYYCINSNSEMVVCIFGAERETVVHIVTTFNLAAQIMAVVQEYR